MFHDSKMTGDEVTRHEKFVSDIPVKYDCDESANWVPADNERNFITGMRQLFLSVSLTEAEVELIRSAYQPNGIESLGSFWVRRFAWNILKLQSFSTIKL